MPDSHEKFKNVTTAIQSIVVASAVIIGGIWTAYTFSSLKTREKAEAELALERAARDRDKAEQERQASYGLGITVEAKQEQFAGDDYILASVKITNKGIRDRFIDFSEPPFYVAHIEFDADGNSTLLDVHDQKSLSLESVVLRTADTIDVPFVVRVPKKGFYLVSLEVELTKDELEFHKKGGGPDVKGIFWGGRAYVLVK